MKRLLFGIIILVLIIGFVPVLLVQASPAIIYVPDNYSTIQVAVDAASPGDTIIVKDGTYIENIIVNKSLSIASENGPILTIIQAADPNVSIIDIWADDVTISGFTIIGASGATGIDCISPKNMKIYNNILSGNSCGIDLYSAQNAVISNNKISDNHCGINLFLFSVNHTISHNNMLNNDYAMDWIAWTGGHTIYLNNFKNKNNNRGDGIATWNSKEQIIYHYNDVSYTNYLGNYWSDYIGSDSNRDGIGDTPYKIGSTGDNYPLMEPFENYIYTPTGLVKISPDNNPLPAFKWNAVTGASSYEVKTDYSSWKNIGNKSTYVQTIVLAKGNHTFFVRAIDISATPGTAASIDFNVSVTANLANTKIVFDNYVQVYIANSDLTNLTKLTNSGQNICPRWSPDGLKIAFYSNRDGNWEIYLMKADGSDQIPVSRNPADDVGPSWSPDGSKIAFSSNRDGKYEIYAMNVDGSGQTRLTHHSDDVNYLGAHWSPDGTRIVFESQWSSSDTNRDIWVINADGTGLMNLTSNNSTIDDEPSWSPDGTKIAFTSDREHSSQIYNGIYLMNPDGTNQTRITPPGQACYSFTEWSPDCSKLMLRYSQSVGSPYTIATMNIDGSGLSEFGLNGEAACWSPFLTTVSGPIERGLEVTVQTSGSYNISDTVQFEVNVANATDKTNINVTASNTQISIIPPKEIEMASISFSLGDLAPGQSASHTFSGIAKQAGMNIEIMANAQGWDAQLRKPMVGTNSCFLSVSDPSVPLPTWSFAIITDLHVGYENKLIDDKDDPGHKKMDYDGDGWNDTGPGDYYDLTNRLFESVVRIIQQKVPKNIQFVMVLGDISDTAEKSEFLKAREILNQLNDPNGDGNTDDGIPYIPLLGNHDIWPYTEDEYDLGNRNNCANIAPGGKGDAFFKEVFWGSDNQVNVNLITSRLQNWRYDDNTDITLREYGFELRTDLELGSYYTPSRPWPGNIWHLYSSYQFHIQNYGFTYGGMTFICLDQNPRNPDDMSPVNGNPLPGATKGSWGTDYPSTISFAQQYFRDHPSSTVMLFSHYTMGSAVEGIGKYILSESTTKPEHAYIFAGHVHRNADTPNFLLLDGIQTQRVCTEDIGRIDLGLGGAIGTILAGNWEIKDYNGEVVRVVAVTNNQVDPMTTMTPLHGIDVLWPSPFFTSTFASYPQPNVPITFTAFYTIYHGFEISYNWNFGDSTSGTSSIVSHTYQQDGDYPVTLTVTTKNLLTGNLTTSTITKIVLVRSKYVISGLPPNLFATSIEDGSDLTHVSHNTYQPILIGKNSSGTTQISNISNIGIHFENATMNTNLSNLVADTDLAKRKSIIYMPSWPGEIEQYKNLYVPSTGTGLVYFCKNAKSLNEVNFDNADLILKVGESKDGIEVGTTYYNGKEYYLISGIQNGGSGEVDTTPPSTPVVIDDGVYTSSTAQLHAKWSASDAESGIAEYQYAIGTSPGATDVVNWTSVGTNIEVTKNGLALSIGTTYYFAVKARNGTGLWSNVGTSDGITPSTNAPTNLAATPASSSQINLTWQDNSNNETGFKIERKTAVAGNYIYVQIATLGANITSYSDTNLTANTTYYYRVKACGTGWDSDYSNEANATTLAQGKTISTGVVKLQPVEYRPGQPAPGYSRANWPIFESWMNVRVENKGTADAFNVKATITRVPANVTIVDGQVSFGNILKGTSAWSTDTFRVKTDTSKPSDPKEGIVWKIEYDDAFNQHHAIENVPQFPPK